jgi:Rrf2 family nitric oxide-sensitive transcriptional repressor
MRLTTQTDYALRVLVYLAISPKEHARIRDIADAYKISRDHLAKIVQKLQHVGFVSTARGKGGGVRLCSAINEINIGTVVREMEGTEYLVECFSPDNQCVITCACSLPKALREAVEGFMAALDHYTLEDIVCQRSVALRKALQLDDSSTTR